MSGLCCMWGVGMLLLLPLQSSGQEAQTPASQLPAPVSPAQKVTLTQAVEVALRNNPQILAATHTTLGAHANLVGQSAPLNPTIAYAGINNVVAPTDFSNPSNYTVAWTLETSGRQHIRTKQARAQLEGAQADAQTTRLAVRQAVQNAYVTLQVADSALQNEQEAYDTAKRLSNLTEQQFKLGAAPETNAIRSSIALTQEEQNLYTAVQNVLVARANLNLQMGRDAALPIDAAEPLAYQPITAQLSDLQQQALRSRPEIQSAQASKRELQATVQCILAAAQEVQSEIFFTTVIIIMAYLPLFTMQSVEKKMFTPMAYTISLAMIGSLLMALLVAPVLCYLLLRGKMQDKENWATEHLKSAYRHTLEWAMAHPMPVLVAGAGLVVLSLLIAPRLGTEFLPHLDEGNLWIRATMPTTISYTEAGRLVPKLRTIIAKYQPVSMVVSQLGRPDDGTDATGFYNAEFFVNLKPYDEWRGFANKDELINKMNAELTQIPGVSFNFSQNIEDNVEEAVTGVKGELAVKLFGGIFALYLTHFHLSVAAAVGFIALFGVVVQNGVIMVSYFDRLRAEGIALHEAVIEGAVTRLRPVLMTAILASIGLVPAAVSTGIGSDTQKPLAIVIIGGLISATILTLVVLPVCYALFARPVLNTQQEPAHTAEGTEAPS